MSTKLNVYGFGVQLKSDIATGNQGGRNMAVISASPDGARADLIEYVGDDLAKLSGPTVIVEGALYAAGEDAPPVAPVNTVVPQVQGVAAVGEVLTCTMGEWTGEPTSYAYQWKGDDTTALGSGAEYTVLAGDAGTSITCVVTATNAAGSADAPPSNAIAIPGAAKSSHHRK